MMVARRQRVVAEHVGRKQILITARILDIAHFIDQLVDRVGRVTNSTITHLVLGRVPLLLLTTNGDLQLLWHYLDS